MKLYYACQNISKAKLNDIEKLNVSQFRAVFNSQQFMKQCSFERLHIILSIFKQINKIFKKSWGQYIIL